MIFLAGLLHCAISLAQQQPALHGKVTGPDGNPLQGVYLLLEGTAKDTYTDEKGMYAFNSINRGKYTLVVFMAGFKTIRQPVHLTNTSAEAMSFALEEDIRGLDEVLVSQKKSFNPKWVSSGLRLNEPLIEIPQNIQVIGTGLVREQQLFNLSDGLERNVSGVRRVNHHPSYALMTIRGFDSRAGSARNGLNVSGYLGPLQEDMSFVDRIEFVKGPAGFMLGNTSPGGFYNVVTKKPTGSGDVKAAVTVGSFDTYRMEADVDDRLDKKGKLLYRMNLMGKLQRSHIDNNFSNGYVLAPSVRYLISDKTWLTAEYIYQYNAYNDNAPYIYSRKGFKEFPVNTSYSDSRKDPIKVNDHSALLSFTHRFSSRWKLTAQASHLKYSMRGEQLAITKRDAAGNNIDEKGNGFREFSLLDLDSYTTVGQAYVNGDVYTGAVRHRILSGIDVKRNEYYADWSKITDPKTITPINIYDIAGAGLNLKDGNFPVVDRSRSLKDRAGVNHQQNQSLAVYLQDELGLIDDRLRVSLGGRFTTTRRKEYNDKKTKNDVFTPRVGISYSITENASIYSVYDRTFEENYAPPLEDGSSAKPSLGTNIELGLKKDWLNGRFNTTLAIFNITKNNITTQSPAGSTPVYSIQLGEVRSRGVELDIKGEPLPNLNMVINYAYTDARITKDVNKDNIDNYLPGSAKHVTNSWFTYVIPGTYRLAGLGFSAGHQLQIDRAAWPAGKVNILPDSYFSLSGGVSYQRSHYNISLLVNNITNNYNYTGYYPGAFRFTHYGWIPDAPRNFRVRLGYTFATRGKK